MIKCNLHPQTSTRQNYFLTFTIYILSLQHIMNSRIHVHTMVFRLRRIRDLLRRGIILSLTFGFFEESFGAFLQIFIHSSTFRHSIFRYYNKVSLMTIIKID